MSFLSQHLHDRCRVDREIVSHRIDGDNRGIRSGRPHRLLWHRGLVAVARGYHKSQPRFLDVYQSVSKNLSNEDVFEGEHTEQLPVNHWDMVSATWTGVAFRQPCLSMCMPSHAFAVSMVSSMALSLTMTRRACHSSTRACICESGCARK